MNLPGDSLPFVLHSLPELEEYVKHGGLTSNSDPVLVVGAGLSAADAILSMQARNLPVVHVFRKAVTDPGLIFSKLPSAVYPEYHRYCGIFYKVCIITINNQSRNVHCCRHVDK